ncbi:uncharacterized protein J7T54_005437 [Emericellopsis cladophorae]|uniref:DnaJ homologue subfamily C member 28 conserved domain-containing protein n=1 Tax=Emericellopsis cladophorae TaxID=2686198 RepID=A0A9Q0BDA0_9HYPO|nr:uncharacterized protein J7T54_005437 [Emericellopsis cladophorae]KAI6780335.1 hypothetical protein J7T54_005437 [Emericellopsis cladophorae]
MPLRLAGYSRLCRVCHKPVARGRRRAPRCVAYSSSAAEKKSTQSEKVCNAVSDDSSRPVAGAMSRRLQEATEEALQTGGRAGRRAVEDAGFDDELKQKLLDKVQDANFRNDFASAFAQADMTPAAGEGTRSIASAQAWTGEETTHDAVLRMLSDAKKPLQPGLRAKFQPPPVDMRIRREPVVSAPQRVATARERAQHYAGAAAAAAAATATAPKGGSVKDKGLDAEEREALRSEFRERFAPGARAMPNSITGLAALANERIEDAIARGQFKDIPRGRGIERDTRANNPFIDTTEYIMNKMIQRQEIVPPWIEKQQDLVRQADIFRARLRVEWKRHVARTIASKGGSLLEQMSRAELYARAEQVHNPRLRRVDQIAVAASSTDDPVMVKIRQPVVDDAAAAATGEPRQQQQQQQQDLPGEILPAPFRDPEWERTEAGYLQLSIENLNKMTREYNLMAPDLAKKPYFSLPREMASLYADVAPEVAREIQDRATRPRQTISVLGAADKKASSFLQHFKTNDRPRVLESREKAYGLREWWRELWGKA